MTDNKTEIYCNLQRNCNGDQKASYQLVIPYFKSYFVCNECKDAIIARLIKDGKRDFIKFSEV